MIFEPKLPDETVNYSSEHPLVAFFKVAGILVGIIVGLYFLLSWSMELLAEHLPLETEQKMFRFIKTSLWNEEAPVKLDALAKALHECALLDYDSTIVLSSSTEANAFALPGGVIVLNQGLIDEMASENELAFIVAHEMGHLKHRDHLKGMGRALVGLSIAALLGLSEVPEVFHSGLQFGESRFSQAQESAADLYALDVVQCHYGHVGGASDFFKRHKDNDPSKWLLFTTHPELVARIDTLEQERQKRGYSLGALAPALIFKEEK